jgi:hypothetical protein
MRFEGLLGGTALAGLVLGFAPGIAGAGTPAWVNGKDPRYSSDQYVVGVGKGNKQEQADIDARAEISRVFESKIAAVMQDFQSAANTVNSSGKGVSIEVQKVDSFQKVTTKKTLEGVDIRERDKDGTMFYALALLDRAQCVESLTGQIQAIDEKVNAALQSADGGDKLGAFKAYAKAMNMMDDREGLNSMLRVCNKQGKGIPPPISIGDLAAKFEEASGNFHLGIDLKGSGAGRVRDCLMEQIGNKGYQIKEIEVDEDDADDDKDSDDSGGGGGFDAIIKGTLKSEPAGEINGSIMVRTQLTVKLINGKTKKVVKTFTGNRKEGRRDIKSSAALSAFKLCQKDAPNIAAAIDQYFKK